MAAERDRKKAPRKQSAPKRLAGGPRSARDLDRVIHERVRLGIVSALGGVTEMSFVELKDALDLTDGNLSVHARRLEEAGYVKCTKKFDGRVPRTTYRLTAAGRRALERYVEHMEAIMRAARRD